MLKPQTTTRTIPKKIYNHVAERGRLASLPGLWSHLKPRGIFFHPPQDSGRLLASVQSEFSMGDLVGSDVIELNSAGAVSLVPMLLNTADVLYAPRQGKYYQPAQLLSSTGALPRGNWNFDALLKDYHLRRLLENSGNLVVADSLVDVMVLWASGIPALPAAGLILLAEPRLSVLRKFLGVPSISSSKRILTAESISWGEDGVPKPFTKLVFANWSVGQLALDRPDNIESLCANFHGLQTYLLPAGVCRKWTPQAADLERLQFSLQFGNKRAVQLALVESMATSSQPLVENDAIEHMAQANSEAKSAIQLIDDCMKLLPTLTDSTRRQRVWNWLLAALERELIRPLLVAAESARTLPRRFVCMVWHKRPGSYIQNFWNSV